MPKSGGLPDVSQKITLDNSGYHEGTEQNVTDAIRMAESNKTVIASLRELGGALDDIAGKTRVPADMFGGSAGTSASVREMLSGFYELRAQQIQYANGFQEISAISRAQASEQMALAREVAQMKTAVAAEEKQQLSDIARVAVASIQLQRQAASEAAADRISYEQALQAEIRKTTQATEQSEIASARLKNSVERQRRVTSNDLIPSSLSALAASQASEGYSGPVGEVLDAAAVMKIVSANSARNAGDALLMSRMISGMNATYAAPAPADAAFSSPDSFADALGGALAARLFPAGTRGTAGGADFAEAAAAGAAGARAAAGYGAYDAGSAARGASGLSSEALLAGLADVDETRRYSSVLPGLLAGGGVAAIGGLLSSGAVRDTISTAATTAAIAGAAAVGAIGRAAGGAAVGAAVGIGAIGDAAMAAGGAISGGGSFDEGTVGETGRVVTGWLGRVLPIAHYVMMGINEVLATAGPALAAAGAAGAVGLEGGQTAYTRLSAINAVGQSLGSAIGETPGQFVGLGATLQNAQTKADPAVWELMGAAINSIKGGGLSGTFNQLGTNTIDMVDRFASKVVSGLQGGGGKDVSSLVSQGTNDLQQFGDVLGNLGTTFLHVAPALPGVGGDLLTTLQGLTRGVSDATGAIPTNLLGLGLAAEAGGRYGPALVGSLATYAGRLPGNFLGTAARTATAEDIGQTYNPATAGLVTDEGEEIAGTGAAGAAGSLGALDIAAAAAGAYAIGKIATAQSPAQQRVGGLQGIANQDDFSQDFGDLLSNITAFSGASGGTQGLSPLKGFMQGLGETTGVGKGFNLFGGAKDAYQGIASLLGGPEVRTPAGTYSVAEQNAAAQLNDLLAAGPAMQKMLGGGSLSNAYSIADMAGLQGSQLQQLVSGTAAQKENIKNQLLNEDAGYKVMDSSPGVYGANVNAVQAMSGLQGTHLSTVNNAWDQVLSNATGGTASAAGFAGGMQALGTLALPAGQGPSGSAVKALETALGISSSDARSLAASGATPQSIKSVTQALTGFTSQGSQAAWSAFSNPSTTSPGALQQAESMTDWLRTAQTVSGGGISQGQFNQASAYEMKQLLPYAKESPAALAQLGVLSQQSAGPGYQPGESQAENYKNISKSIDEAAGSQKQYNDVMNKATIATADVSSQALQFGATMKENTYAALAGGSTGLPQVSQDMEKFKASFTGGGKIDTSQFKSAAQSIASDLSGVKASAGDTGAILTQALSGKGLSSAQIASAIKQVQGDIDHLNGKSVKITANAEDTEIRKLEQEINSLNGKTVRVTAEADISPVVRLAAELASIHSKTISITEQLRTIGSLTPVGGVASGTISGGGGGMRITNAQTGWRVPGYGGGDIFPAMLEPGEAVVPKHLVSMIAPFLGSHKVPGFAAGGIMGGEFANALSEASFTANNLGMNSSNMSGQQWQHVFATFMRVAMMARQMQSATGFAAGGVVPWMPAGKYRQLRSEWEVYKEQMQSSGQWYDSFDQWYTATDGGTKPIGGSGGGSGGSGGGGGSGGSGGSNPGQGGLPGSTGGLSSSANAFLNELITDIRKSGIGNDFAVTLIKGMTSAITGNGSAQTSKLATALVNQLTTEITYARNVSSAAQAGQGYGTQGLISGFTVASGPSGIGAAPPGTRGYNAAAWNAATTNAADDTTPAQTVQQQMQSYLGTVKSFTKDLHKVTREGLSKGLISQVVAAGPTQGDELIQSILSGSGGVKGANKLWKQIGSASNALGAQAAMSQYGGMISPNLKSATVTSNNVTINVDVPGGGGGSLNLSPAQIKTLTEIIQAKLLQQAKRNPKTGLKLSGKGS